MGLEEKGVKDQEVPTYIGNIGCYNDSSVFIQVHLEVDKKPAILTITMTNKKAEEVAKTLDKAVLEGKKWLETGVPPK